MNNIENSPTPAFTAQELYDATGTTARDSSVIGWLLRVTLPVWFAQREVTLLLENRDKLAVKTMTPADVAAKKIAEIDSTIGRIFNDAGVVLARSSHELLSAAISEQRGTAPTAQQIVQLFQRKDAWPHAGRLPETLEDFRLALEMPGANKARLLAEIARRAGEIRARENEQRVAALADVIPFADARIDSALSALAAGRADTLFLEALLASVRSSTGLRAKASSASGVKRFGMAEPLCLYATDTGWALTQGCVVKG